MSLEIPMQKVFFMIFILLHPAPLGVGNLADEMVFYTNPFVLYSKTKTLGSFNTDFGNECI
jgi:hypothetical protein